MSPAGRDRGDRRRPRRARRGRCGLLGWRRRSAAETVNETYLQHFELVEGPLEEVDEELNEELEEQIREELVDEIEAGAPVADVDDLIAEIETGLDEAERPLAGGLG